MHRMTKIVAQRTAARWRLWRQRIAERRQLDLVMRRANDHLRADAGLEARSRLRSDRAAPH